MAKKQGKLQEMDLGTDPIHGKLPGLVISNETIFAGFLWLIKINFNPPIVHFWDQMGFIFKFRFYYPNGDNFDNNTVWALSIEIYGSARKTLIFRPVTYYERSFSLEIDIL